MIARDSLRGLINRRKKMILSALELLGIEPERFRHVRKLVLDQLGEGGLEGDLVPLVVDAGSEGNGLGRNRRDMKGGAR
jgi:hypothetical protein